MEINTVYLKDVLNKKGFASAKPFSFFGSIFSLFEQDFLGVSCSSSIAYNGLQLGEVAEIEV